MKTSSVSYLHGVYLDSFQTTKSYYIENFNSFLEVVYPGLLQHLNYLFSIGMCVVCCIMVLLCMYVLCLLCTPVWKNGLRKFK